LSKALVTDDAQAVFSGKSVAIDVLSNDEAGATLLSVSKPAHGRAVTVQGRAVYVSDDGFDGEDSFEYWMVLPSGERFKARVVVQVKGTSITRELALTGANSRGLTSSALALLALGLLLMFASKRRNEEDVIEAQRQEFEVH
jgi:Bacterial Ig domain